MKRFVLLGLAAVLGALEAGARLQHTVSVTLNYDFSESSEQGAGARCVWVCGD